VVGRGMSVVRVIVVGFSALIHRRISGDRFPEW